MQREIIKRYRIIAWLLLKNGRFIRFLLWTLSVPPLYLFNLFFMKLDKLFIPKLSETEIKEPVFFIGHPRSGTSTLQKILSTSPVTSSFNTWEIIFPSIIQQGLFHPLLKFMQLFNLQKVQSGKMGHEIFIDETEEDEGIFLHHLDTEILTLFCPWLLIDNKYSHYGFRIGWNDYRSDKESIKFYHNAIKRLLYKHNKDRFIAKCNPGLFRLLSILEIFPDAKIIYIIREPEKSIKSFFSFHNKFIENILTQQEKRRYYKAKYNWSKKFYNYFEDLKELIPQNNLMVLPFRKIINMDENTRADLQKFTSITIHPEINKKFKKCHSNQTLDDFFLNPKLIQKDLSFVRENYLEN